MPRTRGRKPRKYNSNYHICPVDIYFTIIVIIHEAVPSLLCTCCSYYDRSVLYPSHLCGAPVRVVDRLLQLGNGQTCDRAPEILYTFSATKKRARHVHRGESDSHTSLDLRISPGLRPFGHVLVQFMMVWHRYTCSSARPRTELGERRVPRHAAVRRECESVWHSRAQACGLLYNALCQV